MSAACPHCGAQPGEPCIGALGKTHRSRIGREHAPACAPQAIAAALHRQGLTTQTQQAEALGERREHWNRYLKGRKRPAVVKLQRWLQAADQAGHTLHLTLDPHIGWVCKVAS